MTRDERFLKEAFPTEGEFLPRLARLRAGEPLGYLLGEWDFYDLTFHLNRHCLIPRPETEHLVEYAIKHLPEGAVFGDFCTGSGCIAVTVLKHRPDVTGVALDISPQALEMAKENAQRYGVLDRLTFLCADLLEEDWMKKADPRKKIPQLDWILCNPPYIPSQTVEGLDKSVKDHEPRIALDGGEDGLDFYRVLLSRELPRLPKEGQMVLEIGYDQGDALRQLGGSICPRRTVTVYRDYSGQDRVAVLS